MTFIKVIICAMLLSGSCSALEQGANKLPPRLPDDEPLKRPPGDTSQPAPEDVSGSNMLPPRRPGNEQVRRPPDDTSKPATQDGASKPPPQNPGNEPIKRPQDGTFKPAPEDGANKLPPRGPENDAVRRPPGDVGKPSPDDLNKRPLPNAENLPIKGPPGEDGDLNRIPQRPPSRPDGSPTKPVGPLQNIPENVQCVVTERMCGSNCTQNGGRCLINGTVCCNIKEDNVCVRTQGMCGSDCMNTGGTCTPNGRACCHNTDDLVCDRTKTECGKDCTGTGGVCVRNGTVCCYRKEDLACSRTQGICGSECTQSGGVCFRNRTACCHNKDNIKCARTEGTCGISCTQSDGICMKNGTACCHSKEDIQCVRTEGKCGLDCKQTGGSCMKNGTACCHIKERPSNATKRPIVNEELAELWCLRMVRACDINCTKAGGRCVPPQKCCFAEPKGQANGQCYRTKGTCGIDCTNSGGSCKNGAICCRPADGNGKSEHIKKDDAEENIDYNSEEKEDGNHVEKSRNHKEDDGYINYNGMMLRCISSKCTKKCSRSRGGFCIKGNCCYKKTENEVQSRCNKEKQQIQKWNVLNKFKPGSAALVERLNCTPGGSYLARCKGQECHCLNASSGERIGMSKKVAAFDKIDCDIEHRKTKPERIRMNVKVSDNPMSTYTQSVLNALKSAVRDNLEKNFPVEAEIKLFEGSVMGDVTLGLCSSDDCAATAQTTDLFSISSAIVSEINQGNILFELNEELIVLSDANIKNIQTAETLKDLEKDFKEELKETKNAMMVTIITVVAVVVVVLVIGFAVACYCNRRSKYVIEDKWDIYHDIKGNDNPSYIKT